MWTLLNRLQTKSCTKTLRVVLLGFLLSGSVLPIRIAKGDFESGMATEGQASNDPKITSETLDAVANNSLQSSTSLVGIANGDFESGSLTGWTASGDTKLTIEALDPVTNNSLHEVAEGRYAAMIGDETPWGGVGNQNSSLEQTVSVPPDIGSGAVIQFAYAVVANDPPDHPETEKPAFRLTVEDMTAQRILTDTQYIYTSQTSTDWYLGQGAPSSTSFFNLPFYYLSGDRWVFRPWSEVRLSLLNLEGHELKIRFEVHDCNWGAHAAYGYLDAVHIGQPIKLQLPDVEGNPPSAVYLKPPFWAPLLLQLEQWGMVWLCFWLPLLLLVGFLLWLFLRPRQPRGGLPSAAPEAQSYQPPEERKGGASVGRNRKQ